MPIDPRIALGYQAPQIESPVNMMMMAQKMQSGQQENQLRQFQMQQMQQEAERSNQLRQTLSGIDLTTPEGQAQYGRALFQTGNVEEGQKYAASVATRTKAEREADLAKLTLGSTKTKIVASEAGALMQDPTLDFAKMQSWATTHATDGFITPAAMQNLQAMQNARPEELRAALGRLQQQAIDADKQIELQATAARDKEASRSRGVTEANEAARLKIEGERLGLERRRLEVDEDTKKRNTDPVFQQQMAQARATGEAIGKGEVAAQQALPGAIASAESAVNIVDTMVGKEAVVKDGKVIQAATKPHPGFANAVGTTWKPGARFVPGTDAANFMGYLDQINGAAFLQAYTILKGTGPIATKEGERATAAVTRMKTALSEDEFITAAREFQDSIRKATQAAQKKAGNAPAGAGGVDANNPLLKQP
jgi:hypothetical protein